MKISFNSDKLKKWPKLTKFHEMAKSVFSWPAHFYFKNVQNFEKLWKPLKGIAEVVKGKA